MSDMGATLRTAALFLLLFALFGVIGWAIGTVFMSDWVIATAFFLILAALLNSIGYFFGSKIVLWSYGAKIVSPQEAPRLHKIVQEICLRANLPMPKIAVIRTATPNAFATGRNKKNAVVAATTGLLDILDDEELRGVLAHEMAHVKDKDILIMTVAATIAGAISFAARMLWFNSLYSRRREGDQWIILLVAITVPIAAFLTQLAISRSREYKADYEGAMLIQRPRALARALAKLEENNRRRPIDRGNPASASLFIVNPFRGEGFVTLFSTHPPIKERIRRLEEMANKMGMFG